MNVSFIVIFFVVFNVIVVSDFMSLSSIWCSLRFLSCTALSSSIFTSPSCYVAFSCFIVRFRDCFYLSYFFSAVVILCGYWSCVSIFPSPFVLKNPTQVGWQRQDPPQQVGPAFVKKILVQPSRWVLPL